MAAGRGGLVPRGPDEVPLRRHVRGAGEVAARGRVYDAYYAREWTNISDGSLVRMAIEVGRVLLTSDRGFLKRKPVRDEEVPLLMVTHLPLEDQLRLVVGSFDLVRRSSRGMPCSGSWRRCSREPWSSGCRRH